ncbi:hypothetical protein M5689_020925 [Euphorbia peplus]|nr:hypothetical protein M5689_020925 [Euphorbia peplus]
MVVSEPLPTLVQTTISVEPSGKIVAEKPKDVPEKEVQDAEDARLAEREKAAEAEKVARVTALADEKRKKKEAEDKLAAEREIAAKAKADARIIACVAELEDAELSKDVEASEDGEDSEDIPLSSRIKKKTRSEEKNAEDIPLSSRLNMKAVAKRRVLRKKDFVVASSAELEDPAVEQSEAADEDLLEKSVEEDVDAPLIEELSQESEPEDEEVLQGARQFV